MTEEPVSETSYSLNIPKTMANVKRWLLTHNYWVFGFFPSSGILKNTTFRKLDLFPSSGEGGGEDTYSVWSLRNS
jgi:hypothetical protein